MTLSQEKIFKNMEKRLAINVCMVYNITCCDVDSVEA